MTHKRKSATREILEYGAIILLAILLSRGIHIAVGIILNVSTPFLVVASGSMEPTIRIGDIIVVRGVNVEELKVGDIIVFNPPEPYYNGVPWVHRIISVQKVGGEIYIKTKGDANLYPDPFTITKSNIIGVVMFKIPYIGLISLNLIQWIIPIIIIALAVIIVKIFLNSKQKS